MLSILVAVCFAAQIEVFRNLAEIRSVLNLQDEATPLALANVGVGVGDVGLPDQLAYEPKAIVVFLSAKCGTCLAIADAFRGGFTRNRLVCAVELTATREAPRGARGLR